MNKKEYGGYFELDLNYIKPNGESFHSQAVALNSGRSGLRYIVRALQIKNIYVPYYTCPTIWEALKAEQCNMFFYDITNDLMPITTFPKDAFILYTNYFGVCSYNIERLSAIYPNLIIDNSHAFYFPFNKGLSSFYSPRKFFDVTDGGYVYCPQKLNINFETDHSADRYLYCIKRLESGANAGYSDFKLSEDLLDKEPIKYMSHLTESILSKKDYGKIKQIRMQNLAYLHKELGRYNLLHLKLTEDDVAYKYPFVFKNDTIRHLCIQNGIFLTKCWDTGNMELPKSSYSHTLQNYLFPIPLDQRYTIEDMQYLSSFIKHIIE